MKRTLEQSAIRCKQGLMILAGIKLEFIRDSLIRDRQHDIIIILSRIALKFFEEAVYMIFHQDISQNPTWETDKESKIS